MSRVTQSSGEELYLCSEPSLFTVSILHCKKARGCSRTHSQTLSSLGGLSEGLGCPFHVGVQLHVHLDHPAQAAAEAPPQAPVTLSAGKQLNLVLKTLLASGPRVSDSDPSRAPSR